MLRPARQAGQRTRCGEPPIADAFRPRSRRAFYAEQNRRHRLCGVFPSAVALRVATPDTHLYQESL